MSFLSPLFLVGALAIAIPIVLHLFRRKTHTVVEFSAVRLLHSAPVERQRRRRLREIVLLVLRTVALALLALAFARPYWQTPVAGVRAPTTVVALDTSLSLTGPGQFDHARQAARQAVERVPPAGRVALMTFSDTARVLVPATVDRGAVLAALEQVTPTSGGTRYRTALARAAEAIDGVEGRIIIVTDLQQAGWEAADEGAVPEGIDVELVRIPPPEGNVAVTALRRDGAALVAAVHNFGVRPVRLGVRARAGGRDVGAQAIAVPAQAAAEVRLTADLPVRGGIEVRVDDPSGYGGDNVRYLVLDPPGAVPVYVVTAESPGSSNAGLYVERALQVADDGRAFEVKVIDGRRFSALTGEAFGEPGTLLLLGTSSLERAGRERIAAFLRDGGRVLLTLGPDLDPDTLADTVGSPVDVEQPPVSVGARSVTLVVADVRHPVFRPFLSPAGALGDVSVERYRRLVDRPDRLVLARFSDGAPALSEESLGRGRLLVFASDLENRWNRFPINPAFVPWAVETARYLTGGRERRQSFTLPGVPPGVPAEPGVHPISTESGGEAGRAGTPEAGRRAGARLVAVNPDVRESNPAAMAVDAFMDSITRVGRVSTSRGVVEAREQEERQRLWQVGLLAMLLALAVEGLVGRRAA
jgi:hypothetical protein